MVEVREHGRRYDVQNPQTLEWEDMINVVFVEPGRSGANASLTKSTEILNRLTGTQTGLEGFRTHTQPVLASEIKNFPIGAQFDTHITRALYSEEVIPAHYENGPQNVNGIPTFFLTEFCDDIEDDKDNRMDPQVLRTIRPDLWTKMRARKTNVRVTSVPEPPANQRTAVEAGTVEVAKTPATAAVVTQGLKKKRRGRPANA